ncbi:MAG: 3-hydroxyacyl-CoA dehydrogenase NAD-binding domain-containing protein, partial [Syntrophales bacterium]|nr:3-hydroxyacyl-CoA dehydrogenase NAD-binding domain-containing protein [Syntrophales bacterium]
AGMMGHGIALIFARAHYQVSLTDVNDEILSRAIGQIQEGLFMLAQAGIAQEGDISSILERIRVTRSLEETVSEASFVIEAITEDLDLKQDLFQKLDAFCSPETILATNTSVISITEIASKAKKRDRIVGTHFWNPPYLIPLVEVVKGQETSLVTMDAAVDLLRRVGKHPVRVMKDVPGFVGNRLQHALWREAISIVEQGIADSETVDEVVKKSFGVRLPVLGPLENADMVGLDLTLQIHDYILKHLERSPYPSPLLKEKVDKKELGFKSGRGFRQWTQERMDQCRSRLIEHLIAWHKSNSEKNR